MIRLAAIDHVVLRVRDMDRMIRFYGDVLGAHEERRIAELGLVQLRAGGSLLDLVDVNGALGRQGGAAPGAEGRNLDHLCFRLEEWDEAAIIRQLGEHGLTGIEVGRRYGAQGFGPSIYISDPEGNQLELKGPPEAGVEENG